MTELICDICGTSYPDTAPHCPTCGYGRAFEAPSRDPGEAHGAYEKVPGGRFSRKNVRKRLTEQAEEHAEAEAPAQSAAEEIPVEEAPKPEPDPALLKAYRRDVALNLLLSAAVLALLASGGYLLVCYGIPWLQSYFG